MKLLIFVLGLIMAVSCTKTIEIPAKPHPWVPCPECAIDAVPQRHIIIDTFPMPAGIPKIKDLRP